ncbi:MAG: ISL3 family transposase [Oscillospiraceae bacterium]
MRIKGLIQPLVGTKKMVIETIYEDTEANAIVISARPTKREQCRCGICHRKANRYDGGRGIRRWRCADAGTMKVYIESEMPRVSCKEHGVVSASAPWARHKSGFTRHFEETVAWLATHASKSVVATLMRVEWHTVGSICGRVYREMERQNVSRFDGLVNIGIDETSYKKGHKYMTVVINHETASVIWCSVGYGKEVLSGFFEQLRPEQRASIRCVSADGARWIASCVEEYCPNAERCVDPFHVVSWATETLDNERRKAWAEAHQAAKAVPKRSTGRPKKGELANPEKAKAKTVKNIRYALLKNPENLSDKQQAQLQFLVEANPVLHRAYLLKENLRLALKAGPDEIADVLREWMAWAQRCRIPAFRELRLKIKRNFDSIVASAKHGLSNARMEAINNKIKLVIRMAFGFRNYDNMLAMVMLSCSALKPALPGR